MKKLFVTTITLTLLCTSVYSNEITEDYFDIATNYAVNGQYSEAVDYLNKILEIDPQNRFATEMRNSLTYIIEGKTGSYITSKNMAVRSAIEGKKIGSRKKEVDALTNSVNTNQMDYWSNFFLGEYYREICNYEMAAFYYNKALLVKPDFSQCYLSVALCNLELKEYSKATEALKTYLNFNKNSDIGYAASAKILYETEKYEEAEKDIRKALSLNDDTSYNLLFGKILYANKNYTGAKYIFTNLKKTTKLAEVFAYAGYTDYQLGDYKNALINIESAIILSDDDKSLRSKYNEIKTEINQ